MKLNSTLLALACAAALAACGGSDNPPPSQDATPPATSTAPTTPTPVNDPATTPGATTPDGSMPGTTPDAGTDATTGTPPGATAGTPGADSTAPSSGKPAAEVADCATTIEGNDAMQFNVGSITVPSSCTEFTINLKHVGQMPVAAMGHNVVITETGDANDVAQAGIKAGAPNYLPGGDARVIAATDMIGGGQSTSITFPGNKLTAGGDYTFFCSFPGHSGIMRGTVEVTN